ncbi:MAG TPA: protein-glutamate O-methyltransferase [Archangium sp.]|uniref:CheR family methyltransferase n=1 Tax=Archangium sp. TaxID=1872627 RepID=UPI002E2EBAD3|nr:protein-glutamate O-methyltransferase [Archangium sp.]HEX5751312.1 protein-glutamate O-methyltransferase [Archangium sp.]
MSAGVVGDSEFRLFQELVYREAGIFLAPVKKALLAARLSSRLRALGLESFAAYFHYVVTPGHEDERVRMLDCICTNETHFFREPAHFDFLTRRVFPEWKEQAVRGRRTRSIRVWSAACSTGEEPYSLAMVLLTNFPPGSGWDVEVLATDLSTRALERARAGLWPIEKSQEIPPEHLRAFMLKGVRSQEGRMQVGPLLRSVVRFERLNLHAEHYPGVGSFDLLFCRNVLIYFDPASKAGVLRRLMGHLSPQGYLFLGHSESLAGSPVQARCVQPAVYAPLPASPPLMAAS